jgi:hypothetical protein
VPFQCPGSPDQDGGVKRWAEPGSLEDPVPIRCPGPLDQDGGAKRWAESGSLEDSCPSNCGRTNLNYTGSSTRVHS